MGVFALKQTAPVTETAKASEQVSSEPVEPVSTAAGCWDGRDGFVHSGRLLITHLVVAHGFCQLFLGLQNLIKQVLFIKMGFFSLSNHCVGLVLRMLWYV